MYDSSYPRRLVPWLALRPLNDKDIFNNTFQTTIASLSNKDRFGQIPAQKLSSATTVIYLEFLVGTHDHKIQPRLFVRLSVINQSAFYSGRCRRIFSFRFWLDEYARSIEYVSKPFNVEFTCQWESLCGGGEESLPEYSKQEYQHSICVELWSAESFWTEPKKQRVDDGQKRKKWSHGSIGQDASSQ